MSNKTWVCWLAVCLAVLGPLYATGQCSTGCTEGACSSVTLTVPGRGGRGGFGGLGSGRKLLQEPEVEVEVQRRGRGRGRGGDGGPFKNVTIGSNGTITVPSCTACDQPAYNLTTVKNGVGVCKCMPGYGRNMTTRACEECPEGSVPAGPNSGLRPVLSWGSWTVTWVLANSNNSSDGRGRGRHGKGFGEHDGGPCVPCPSGSETLGGITCTAISSSSSAAAAVETADEVETEEATGSVATADLEELDAEVSGVEELPIQGLSDEEVDDSVVPSDAPWAVPEAVVEAAESAVEPVNVAASEPATEAAPGDLASEPPAEYDTEPVLEPVQLPAEPPTEPPAEPTPGRVPAEPAGAAVTQPMDIALEAAEVVMHP